MITRKNLMALTGLFISFFLVIHLLGNLQLLYPSKQSQLQFNTYAKFLSGLLIVKIVSYFLYITILLHIIDAIHLYIKSKKANGKKLIYDKRVRASSWYSRNMSFLGSILFFFLVIHFKDFWYSYKFGALPLDSNGNKDIYTLVITTFTNIWHVLLYLISILALGFHLLHGIFSAHRSIGVFHPFYNKLIKWWSIVFTTLLTLGYIIIPIYIFIKQNS